MAFLFLLNSYSYSSADVVSLTDGTVLNGKMIESSQKEIIFVNFYGTFTISKKKIAKLVETNNYKEDIRIKSEMGEEIDEELIKRNYQAGEAEKVKKEYKKTLARISITGFYSFTLGRLEPIMPWGWGIALDYDHNLFGSSERPYIPWVRIEGGYSSFQKDPALVKGFNVSAGPMWLIPIRIKPEIRLIFAQLEGVSFLDIEKKSTNYKAKSTTYSQHLIGGLEIPYKRFAFTMLLRYTYIYDRDVLLHNIELTAGFSFSI